MKCICHSLTLCANYACSKLPENIEKVTRDVFNYMHQSFKRQKEFQSFQTFYELKPHKLLQPSQTRWLALVMVVNRLLEQYSALVAYFQLQAFESDALTKSLTKDIYKQLNNPITKLYLEFLQFILPTITNLNLEFQSESPKIFTLYCRMADAYRFILSYYIKPSLLSNIDISTLQYRDPDNFVSDDLLYLGPKVAISLEKQTLNQDDLKTFKMNCLNFYIELARQFYLRFPFNCNDVLTLKYLSFVNPKEILNVESLGPAANNFITLVGNINELDREWRMFKAKDFGDLNNCNVIEFWKVNLSTVRGDGYLQYPLLSKFVSLCFILPHSSACVERVFSQINLNKTKSRNRLSTETLCGILYSKQLIKSKNKNCFDYDIPKDLINKHKNSMYKSK